jgi:Holliday junction resolvasome RuvABC endonuclease subunit
MKIIGIDPGLAACGIAVMRLKPFEPLLVRVVRTAKADNRRRLRQSDDLGDRLRSIADVLWEVVREHQSELVAICVEAKAIPFRGGRMIVKPSVVSALGRVRGLVDAIGSFYQLPVLEETAQILKQLTTGDKSASKDDVKLALEKRWPELRAVWPPQKTLHEHAADAVAAAVAGEQSDVVRAALRVHGAAA